MWDLLQWVTGEGGEPVGEHGGAPSEVEAGHPELPATGPCPAGRLPRFPGFRVSTVITHDVPLGGSFGNTLDCVSYQLQPQVPRQMAYSCSCCGQVTR